MFVVAVLALAAVLIAGWWAARRRSHTRVRPSVDEIAAAQRVRSEIDAARVDAGREKGKQWY